MITVEELKNILRDPIKRSLVVFLNSKDARAIKKEFAGNLDHVSIKNSFDVKTGFCHIFDRDGLDSLK